MTPARILVATDFGAASDAALSYACEFARAMGSSLYLLHVVDDIAARFIDFPYTDLGDMQTSIESAARRQLDDIARADCVSGLDVHTAIVTSSAPARAIVSHATDEHIDLIAMGTHGHTPVVRMFLGAVADRVVRTAPCPVLTVHEPKPVRPSKVPVASDVAL